MGDGEGSIHSREHESGGAMLKEAVTRIRVSYIVPTSFVPALPGSELYQSHKFGHSSETSHVDLDACDSLQYMAFNDTACCLDQEDGQAGWSAGMVSRAKGSYGWGLSSAAKDALPAPGQSRTLELACKSSKLAVHLLAEYALEVHTFCIHAPWF